MATPASGTRAELLDIVLRDLLGPAGGPEEEVDETNVRERYLVGLLAPQQQQVSLEDSDELSEGGPDSPDEGPAESSVVPARTLYPSSFGMSFCVAPDAKAFQVAAHWGQYLRQESQILKNPTGQPQLVWKRYPRGGGPKTIPLRAGRIARWIPDEECPEVYVDGLIRRRQGYWSVTLFLVNGQKEPKRRRDEVWLFQPELVAEGVDGKPIFMRRADGGRGSYASLEDQSLDMVYRRRVEFAVGHGVSVHADLPEGQTDRAWRLATRVVPQYELALFTAPTAADFPRLANLPLDMKELAGTPPAELPGKLRPLAEAYAAWIDEQEARAALPEFAPYQEAASLTVERCRENLRRIQEGIALLAVDAQAAEAFRFANRAMWLQRIRSVYSASRRRGQDVELEALDVPENRSWYPFQLAFILLNLPALTRLDHPDRTGETEATCDLLWYPTGGGKTEAYLGLAAYTMALRRLQGQVAGRPGEYGVAVLMRYTLRLLTIQQFQRAAALLCACEVIRRAALDQGDRRWGQTPFRIGLWVGQRVTPNWTADAAEVVMQLRGNRAPGTLSGIGSPYQLTNCPWCGSRIEPGRDIVVEKYPKASRTLIFCGDPTGCCPFTQRQAPKEGLPVVVVDEEIYRLLPALLIATVDKFAQMPWEGRVQMLFGQVEGRCERHGFRSPEVDDADSHAATGELPKARTLPMPPLRPPDLIIQDELHLISGPLGTLVGLYETAVDKLCSWEVDRRNVRPKVIASTATIRRAGDQINGLFLRRVNVFPPPGLDSADNFFSIERDPSAGVPGRLYIGVCAPGKRLKAALIRVYVAFLAAAQMLYQKYGRAADPYMTLVGYFNSLRELGGMRRLVDDDVRARLKKVDVRGLAKRDLYPGASIEELTSRKSSADIPQILDRMEVSFDPEVDRLRKEMASRGERGPRRPLDVLLATNMISVGVDIRRLGLMVVAGQPKATAEYIQATSRIGRQYPGLVCTVYNWARPRDLSHYERFEHYHATFYKHVEPLSVTPFSSGALQRALTGVFVSLVRLPGTEFNHNQRAGSIERNHPYVTQAIDAISRRAELVGEGLDTRQHVEAELNERLDKWLTLAQQGTAGRILGYKDEKDGITVGLLQKPGVTPWEDFTCLNSLREVEPTAGLVLTEGGLDEAGPPIAEQVACFSSDVGADA
jgi:hypothetical protein